MLRPLHIACLVLAVTCCEGHRDIRLLEPEVRDQIAGGDNASAGTAADTTAAQAGAAEFTAVGGNAGTNSVAVALPNAKITFKNLMIIKTAAQIGGQSWQLSSQDVTNISTAFRVTFPALIAEFTAGAVVLDNYVSVSDEPVTSVGYNNDMVEPENVLGWDGLAGPQGSYDCVYLLSARPQNYVYARFDLTSNPTVGWISAGPRADVSKYGDSMAGWLFGWLAAIGQIFYSRYSGLDHVPNINSSDQYGYARNQDGYGYFLAWYRDYLTRSISYNGANWGLGDPAWALGTLRDWAKSR